MKKIDPKYRELNHLFDIIDNPDEDTELVVPTEEDINSQEFPSTQKGYLCRICFSTFTSFTLLNDHTTTTHFTEPKFHCRICMHSVAAESDLNEHLVEAHASDSFTNCPYCQKNFTVFSIEFERHLRNHNLYQNQVTRYGFRNTHRMFYICPNCWMLFWHREQYTQHMTFHSLPEGSDCELCGRKCGTEMELKTHMEKVHKSTKGQKRVALPCLPSSTRMKAEEQVGSITSCPYCNMKISHTMSFDSHLRFFHRGIPAKIPNGQIKCTVCKKVFSDLKALLGHVKYYEVNGNTHGRPKGKQTFTKCSACSKSSKPHLAALKNTKITAKTKCTCGLKKGKVMFYKFNCNSKEAVECPICKKTVKELRWLYVHLDVFHKNFLFVCRICNHSTEEIESLKKHVEWHRNDEDFRKESSLQEDEHMQEDKIVKQEIKEEKVDDAESENFMTSMDISEEQISQNQVEFFKAEEKVSQDVKEEQKVETNEKGLDHLDVKIKEEQDVEIKEEPEEINSLTEKI